VYVKLASELPPVYQVFRVGQNHIYMRCIYGIFAVFLAGKSPNIRSCTVYIYGSGQSYRCCLRCPLMAQPGCPA